MVKRIEPILRLDFKKIPKNKIMRYHFEIAADGLGNPIYLPVFALSGKQEGPTVCVTAALHGNEINGIRVIQRLFKEIDITTFRGTLIGVPVVSVPAFLRGARNFDERVDLNHVMPGNSQGDMTSIYASRFFQRIISQVDSLIDLHTASFGRVNSYYVRADLQNSTIKKMASLLNPEIILHDEGTKGSLRRAATDRGILALTAELRDPYKFQKKIIKDAVVGVINILSFLRMVDNSIIPAKKDPIVCSHSYWLHTTQGGLLTVVPSILALVKKDEIIARVRNIFGEVLREYTAPEKGIVIGKSVNPVNQTGSRILHLGIPQKKK